MIHFGHELGQPSIPQTTSEYVVDHDLPSNIVDTWNIKIVPYCQDTISNRYVSETASPIFYRFHSDCLKYFLEQRLQEISHFVHLQEL